MLERCRPLARWRAAPAAATAAAVALAGILHSSPLPAAADTAAATPLRVGTSGDYAPFSSEGEAGFTGFDVDLARRYAADRGRELVLVRFRWPRLLDDLAAGRFDVAMSGVTVRPERSIAGTFSVPVAETGAVALVPADTWSELDELDRPSVRIGVNAGGHLERAAAQRFPHATIIAIDDNTSVIDALRDAAVQAVVTDSAEAPVWRERLPGLVTLGPFTRDRKAPLVRRNLPELAADLDEWLLARERDGTLAELRRQHLGEGRATAVPLDALLAAVDERLALMPIVGYVKRENGEPLEVPEQEHVVLDAAVSSVLEAASRRDRRAPPIPGIERFFRAQIEAAKQVQRDAVADPDFEPAHPLPDLDTDLRPALLRIGARIARLVVELPAAPADRVHARAGDLLREPLLSAPSRRAIAQAIAEILPAAAAPAHSRTSQRATIPAATGSATQMP
jgi:cyclohexadienyl dehydratase